MARLLVEGSDLVVALSVLEKLGALRGDVRVPVSAVRSADAEARPWAELRGIRLAGTGIPGVVALGTRYSRSGRNFAALYGRGPAVRVELGTESPFSRLLVSMADAQTTAAQIRAAAGV